MQVSSLFNRIHLNLTARIEYLLGICVTTRTEMKRHLKTFIREKFGIHAQQMDSSYFPSDRTIFSTMYHCMMKLWNSKFDSQNVIQMVTAWKQDFPQDLIYFRSKTSEDDIHFSEENDTEKDDNDDDDDILYEIPHIGNKKVQASLLFVHMTKAQRDLMKCYNNLVLMDATYRMCRLMLPTFFLAVKTNVGHSPVATFIVQTEDSASISEVLGRIKIYLAQEHIQIPNFMIDCSATKMQSLRETFPEAKMYLCDFHRNQCWGRWFRSTSNRVTGHYEILMWTFKKMGESPTISEFKKHEQFLRHLDVHRKSTKLQYYYKKWECNKEVSEIKIML